MAVLFVLASVVLMLFVWRNVGGITPLEPKGYRIQVLFSEASQLQNNADVRISGVTVGKVTSVEPRGLRTEATLEIDARFAPLPSDVRAILRQKTLLGETFVALSPGDRDAPPIPEGGTLPVAQVEATQPLDRVLGMLDAPTREHLVSLLTNSEVLLHGREESLNAAAGNLASGTRELGDLMRVLDRQRPALERLLRDGGATLQTIGDARDAVGELVRSGDVALNAVGRRRAALAETVCRAPALLDELDAASSALTGTLGGAAPEVSRLAGITPLVRPGLEAARDVAPQIEALLTKMTTLVPPARRALPALTGLVGAFTPLTTAMAPAAAQIAPMISYVGRYDRELVATLANVSSTTAATSPRSDGTQVPYLRTLTMFGLETATGQERRLGSNRHNAYPAPGGLAGLEEGLASSNCAHAVEGGFPKAPPCRLQEGWLFEDDVSRYFQRVGPAQAGE